MCLCKDHPKIWAEIAYKPKNGINPHSIPKVIRQAVDCHFFYNHSTLKECADAWGMSLDDVKMVSDKNRNDYCSFYMIIEHGEYSELIPNERWFDWARLYPDENLVYDEVAITRKRPLRELALAREKELRAVIENALKSSQILGDSTFTAAELGMHLKTALQLRGRNLATAELDLCLSFAALICGRHLTVADLELALNAAPLLREKNITTLPVLKMCLSAPDALNKIKNDVQNWYETGNKG